MPSGAFDGVMLDGWEYGVRAYPDALRDVLPVVNLDRGPEEGKVAARNADLLASAKAAAE